MPHVNFVHLHNHTQYSLLDGACKIDEFVKRAVELKMPAIAITDHGNMCGAIDFYLKAMKYGIKPIIGSETYVASGSRFDKTAHGIRDAAFHLVLLARNEDGYKNLMKLSSAGYLEGFYYKPRIDKEILRQYGSDLIATSACLKGEVSHLVLNDQMEDAETCIREYQDIFGKENFYLEVMDHGIPEQKKVNDGLFALSKKTGAKVVVTNDIHYLRKQDAVAHEVLLCIQTGKTMHDEKRMKMSTDEFYLKSYEEMLQLFPDHPEVYENTLEVANRCNVEFDFDQMHIPPFNPPSGMTQEQYLRSLCLEGLQQRLDGDIPKDYMDRLEFETEVIAKMGYVSYFLIVWDFIKYSKDNGIFVGPGRGSAAGSLVSYALRITDVDPLRFGLLFERFLNPERVSMPDIDIDFCFERRVEAIEYVTAKYGYDNVSQIITFGTMAARGVIRDVGRALGMAYSEVDAIAKLVPAGPKVTLAMALKQEPQLEALVKRDENVRNLLEICKALEGLNRHASTHAAGVVISDKPLTEHVPLFKAGDQVTTQFTMKILDMLGLLKMDFLGLKTLTVIGKTVESVKRTQNVDIDISRVSFDDQKTYELLEKGETFGVFQLESAGMRDLIRKLKPDNMGEIADLLALYRPGPLEGGMVDDFIKRKHNPELLAYEHPILEPILKETYGVILYQEQVMQIARDMAGFTLAQADNMRRAIGKKIIDVLEAQKKAFVEGSMKNGVTEKLAQRIFDLIVKFAGYGFNKSHSVAYGFISYQTAYLKANFPVEFMASLLTSEKDRTDKIVQYIDEAGRLGIEVLPPCVNESFSEFTPVSGAIRFGLSAIKNVGGTAIVSIIRNREKLGGVFQSIYHFIENVELRLVNRKVLESLIKSGAFDCFGLKRSQMTAMVDRLLDFGNSLQKDRIAGQYGLFDDGDAEDKYEYLKRDEPNIEEWPEGQLLEFEKETLGFYVSSHPLSRHEKTLRAYSSAATDTLSNCRDQQDVSIGGIIAGVRVIMTKKGSQMAFVTIEDLSGKAEVIFFPEVFQASRLMLAEGNMVFIKGKVDARGDDPKILASEIIPLEEVKQKCTKSFIVMVNTTGLDENTLQAVQGILRRYKGTIPVFLQFAGKKGTYTMMELPPDYAVDPADELFNEVEKLLGPRSVRIGL